MAITARLLEFFAKHEDSATFDARDAAREFINSPAYAALLEEAAIGQIPNAGEEGLYLGKQALIYRLNEIAELNAGAVMTQTAQMRNGNTYGLADGH